MTTKTLRGFAALDPDRLREVSSMGGKACPPEKRAYSRDPDLAKAAGRKGGLVKPGARRP